MLRSIGMVLGAIALFAACQGTDPVRTDPLLNLDQGATALRTDRDRYTVRRVEGSLVVDIPYTYTNPTDGPVYVTSCQVPTPPVLEKRVGDEWVTAWAPAVLLCLGPPLVIGAGETYSSTLQVRAGPPGSNVEPRFTAPEVPGEYRLVWSVVRNYDRESGRGEPLPLELQVSNTFRLDLED